MPGRRTNPSAGKGAAERLRRGIGNLGRPEGVRIQRRGELRDRLDDYAEAVALAEAGEQILAERAIARRGTGRKRIMVLGHGADYSARLAEYAILLAERLGYAWSFSTRQPSRERATPKCSSSCGNRSPASPRGGQPWLQAAAEKASRPDTCPFGEQANAWRISARNCTGGLILSEPETPRVPAGGPLRGLHRGLVRQRNAPPQGGKHTEDPNGFTHPPARSPSARP
jgi:hypothetical protein